MVAGPGVATVMVMVTRWGGRDVRDLIGHILKEDLIWVSVGFYVRDLSSEGVRGVPLVNEVTVS